MCVSSAAAQGPDGGHNGQRGGNRGGNGGTVDKSSDAELQKMITEIIPQFELVTWEDPETGISLQYQLFIPADYEQTLRHLSHRHEVIPIVVHDPMEMNLPDFGLTVLEDIATHEVYFADTSQPTMCEDYKREFEKRQDQQKSIFDRCNLAFVNIATDEEIVTPIAHVFERRAKHV